MDLGFELAGWELKWAVEWDKQACETHRHNRKDGEYLLIQSDVREVTPDQLLPVDCIIGGPPCQGFSTANTSRAHANGNLVAWKDDPRNLLYKEYLRLVTALHPKYFVMENVKAMYSTGSDDTGQPGPIMREALRDFAEAGYRVAAEVLNAHWFGVPQDRERTIVIGVRRDMPAHIRFPVQTHGEPGSGYLPWRTVRDAIEDLPDSTPLIPNHGAFAPAISNQGFESGHRELDMDKPSPTISAHHTNQPVHPGHTNRRLTPRECARLQTVPDWYVFCGSKTATYRQIGNGVPVLMAQRIAETLLTGNGGREVKPYQPQLTLDDLMGTA